MNADGKRFCPVCGAAIAADRELCPVCALRGALGDDQGTRGLPVEADLPRQEVRFGHYNVLIWEDGKLFELGRGSMGVTYKALDVDLRCPVALKVINARYLGDESARLRFIREARAAASVRHPNVASVFHLGKSGESYFYAMEFVEGETLDRLIKRSGRLEVKLALQIVMQLAAGLAAVHKQSLVHRDIKPANVMVSLDAVGRPAVKIIDLGLAKPITELASEAAISDPGAFAGTPEFASPEQFTGIGVDIRSDLYSVGITLWQMLTGETPFRGAPTEVMHQHQHTSLPLGRVSDVSEQAVSLLEVLLKKQPVQRFQTPAELLEVLPIVMEAIETGRRVVRTIRVFVSSTGDVQKERNLADRVIRSIAAEFDLTVNDRERNFQRLAEVPVEPDDAASQSERDDTGKLMLCPCFWECQGSRPDDVDPVELLTAGKFELMISIVWSRLGDQVSQTLKLPDGSLPSSATEYEIAWALEHAGRSGGVSALRVYRNCSKPALPLEPKEEREAFGRQWDAVQEFFAQWAGGTGQLTGKVDNYHSLEEFEELFREQFRYFLADRVEQELGQKIGSRKVRRWKSSPFRGLNVFDFEHAPIFYGRTRAVGEVLEALEQQLRAQRQFVLVVGASGSGKSSLVRAGVLPLLTQTGTIEGIGLWRWSVTRPGAGGAGGDCFDALAAALLESTALPGLEDPESLNAIRDLANELREHSESAALRIRDALDHAARESRLRQSHFLQEREQRLRSSGRSDDADSVRRRREGLELPKARLALMVDQLEELFTSGFSPDIRQKYISAIAGLARSGRVFILAALRNDFYSAYQEFPELIELTRLSGKIDLRPPTAHEIGNMIRLPAEAAGLRFEQDRATGQRLDEALRDAAAVTPESLPLLEHVLSLLYDEQAGRGDGLLRWSDYRQLGELKGALAKHAETVFGTLPEEGQSAFSLVMRYLITLGQGEEEVPSRRTVPYRDLVSADSTGSDQKLGAKVFVDLLIEQRLLVADTDPQGNVTVSVAHEALLREWLRVKDWLTENREFLRMRDRLDSSLKLWLSRGKQKDDLLGPGLPLAEGEKLIKDFGLALSKGQAAYVNVSIAEQKRRQRSRERVRYGVMAGITAALIVAIIFGVVSFRQYWRAERAKVLADQAAKRATLARDEAQNLINFMTVDLRDKLKPIGRLDLLYDVNQRVLNHFASLGTDSSSPDVLGQWSIALANSGDIQKDRGDLAGALKSYGDSLGIRERLVHQNPGKANWQRYRALGMANVGDVLNLQGDSSGALERYETALTILKELVAQKSGDADLRRDLSAMQENIGQVLEKRGDLTRALQSYQDCLAIRQELKKQDQGNIERDHDISLVLLKIGRVFSRQGSVADADQSYRDSLALQQKLADAEPTNAMWQQELSSSKDQFGNGLSAQGDLVGALGMYRESLEIILRLAERDPSNATWQRMLARSYSNLSDVFILRGNLTDGLENAQHALEIRDMLAKRDPSNANAQRDLAIANDDVGKVLELQGNEVGAKERYNISLSLSRKLTAQDPNNAEWQRDLSISLERLAIILSAEDDFDRALDKDVESLNIRKKLASRDKSNAQWQNDLSWSYISVGDLLFAKKDMEGALTNYRTAQDIERELIRQDSRALQFQSDLAVTCQKIGDILRIQGHATEALNSYRESVALGEKLVGKDPTNGEWASELALACYSAAITLSKVVPESGAEARTLLIRGRDILVKLQTQNALSPNDEHHLQEIQTALSGL